MVVRLLLPLMIIAALVAGIYYYIFNNPQKTIVSDSVISLPSPSPMVSPTPIPSLNASPLATNSSNGEVINKVNDLSSVVSKKLSSIDDRLNNLESSQAQMKTQVAQIEQNNSSVTNQSNSGSSTTQTKSPAYIPVVTSASATSGDWVDVTGQDIVLNMANYQGYTKIYMETSLRCYQGNGRAYARLFNVTDGTAVLPSELSTSNQDYTYIESASFTLPSSQKTYRLQLKSLTGYSTDIQNVRLRVMFN